MKTLCALAFATAVLAVALFHGSDVSAPPSEETPAPIALGPALEPLDDVPPAEMAVRPSETAPAPGEANDSALIALGIETARTDPLAALALAAKVAPSTGRDELYRHAVNQWAFTDPRAAIAWAGGIEDGTLRHRLLFSIATVWSLRDRAAAAEWVASLGEPALRERCAMIIASRE